MTTEELHLDNIQSGMEIVTITPKKDGFKYGMIKVIGDYSENHKKWRLRFPNESRDAGLLPNDGAGYGWGQKRDTPPSFFYSANPKHIKAAKAAHENARKEREKQEAKDKARFEEFHGKFEALMEEYGASIQAIQTSGDDQGVEMDVELSIGNQSTYIY